MARPLKKTTVAWPNGVELRSVPIVKSKGRHWVAYHDGAVVGEFITWQKTAYAKQGKENYGRGPVGKPYSTSMVRESWLAMEEGESFDSLNTERLFKDWKDKLRTLKHPSVKKIESASV